MSFKRFLLNKINFGLSRVNLHLDTLTAVRQEERRVSGAIERGVFLDSNYPVPDCFYESTHQTVFDRLPSYQEALGKFTKVSRNSVGYQFENGFYSSPDTEVLYTIVRSFLPKHILEIGCGNSTRIIRQALLDENHKAKLTCIDPSPRRDVTEFADEVFLQPVEASKALEIVETLKPNDVLFIDTSHELRPANDCAYIYGSLIPKVPLGVIVHIHDIFLPYEYPEHLSKGDAKTWGEQAVVAVMLQSSKQWQVLWPGYWLQQTMPNFSQYFPYIDKGFSQSLWLCRKS